MFDASTKSEIVPLKVTVVPTILVTASVVKVGFEVALPSARAIFSADHVFVAVICESFILALVTVNVLVLKSSYVIVYVSTLPNVPVLVTLDIPAPLPTAVPTLQSPYVELNLKYTVGTASSSDR